MHSKAGAATGGYLGLTDAASASFFLMIIKRRIEAEVAVDERYLPRVF
jgi:hypothetical protein